VNAPQKGDRGALFGAFGGAARAVRQLCGRYAVAGSRREGKSKAPAASGGGLFPCKGVRALALSRGVGSTRTFFWAECGHD